MIKLINNLKVDAITVLFDRNILNNYYFNRQFLFLQI